MLQQQLLDKKIKGDKIVSLTCYDYTMARMLAGSELDFLLVGDSLSMILYGHRNTQSADLDMMVRHTEAVRAGAGSTPIVGDLPVGTYDDPDKALTHANRLIGAGAVAIKLEGGQSILPQVHRLMEAGITVVGHIGLTPQTAEKYRVHGRDEAEAHQLMQDAIALSESGVAALVLEMIPADLAGEITHAVKAPTIGIGAGPETDGQILVTHDMLGLFEDFKPKFVRRFANLAEAGKAAVGDYIQSVRSGGFPAPGNSY